MDYNDNREDKFVKLMRLVDSSDDPAQLLAWHFLPIFLIMAIGMVVGQVYLGRIWRS